MSNASVTSYPVLKMIGLPVTTASSVVFELRISTDVGWIAQCRTSTVSGTERWRSRLRDCSKLLIAYLEVD